MARVHELSLTINVEIPVLACLEVVIYEVQDIKCKVNSDI